MTDLVDQMIWEQVRDTLTRIKHDEPEFRFTDLTDAVIKAIRTAYNLRRKNKEKDIAWTGPQFDKDNFSDHLAACCFSPEHKLTAENLRYSEEDQGRDALEEIVGVAVQLGIEQGIRMMSKRLNQTDIYFTVHDSIHKEK